MDDKNKKAIEIYNEIAEEYSKTYDPIDNDSDLVFLKTFLSYLKIDDHLVDIGCGTGFSAGWFAKHGIIIEASDFSSKMIDIAKRNYPDLSFSVADMRTYRPKKSSNAVWAGYSMFHFDKKDFIKTIKNIKTYLQPSGILGIVMQEGEGEVEIPEPFLPDKNIYIHLYSEQELRKILDKHGFEVIEVKRKIPKNPKEFVYNKILIISKLK